MPTYEYQCTQCEDRFDVWQEVGAAPPHCPRCGGDTRKVFHAPRVIFKGSGFYITDTRAEKAAQTEKEGSKESSAKNGEAAAATSASEKASEKSPEKSASSEKSISASSTEAAD